MFEMMLKKKKAADMGCLVKMVEICLHWKY